NLFIPVEFVNQADSPGLKRGGVLNVVRHEVELKVRAGAIPEKLVCDLAGAKIGDSLHISAIELPAGVKPVIQDRDFTVATIAAPSGIGAADDDEEEAVEG
ncbi:MAG: 50S ribosomal protein L25, partial [Pseudomonadota bacterium]